MRRLCPDYYEHFTCIAGACPITCCQEWKIAVDDDTARRWKKLAPPADVEEQKKNLNAYTIHKDGERVIRLTQCFPGPARIFPGSFCGSVPTKRKA